MLQRQPMRMSSRRGHLPCSDEQKGHCVSISKQGQRTLVRGGRAGVQLIVAAAAALAGSCRTLLLPPAAAGVVLLLLVVVAAPLVWAYSSGGGHSECCHAMLPGLYTRAKGHARKPLLMQTMLHLRHSARCRHCRPGRARRRRTSASMKPMHQEHRLAWAWAWAAATCNCAPAPLVCCSLYHSSISL